MPIDQQMSGTSSGLKPGADTGNPGIAVPPPPLKQKKKDGKTISLKTPSKKLKDIVDLNPTTTFGEAKEKHAVMTFGRMNPPTAGHEKLINKVHSIAQKHSAKAHIVVSHSHDNKNNPLPQNKKIGYLKKINRSVHVSGSSKSSPSFLHAAKKLHAAGHDHLHMVAGSDRVGEYKKTLNKYNGHPDHYNFKSITVHSAGQRDPDAEGTSGISGTKMRAHAKAGDHKSFKAGLPKALHPHHKQIMSHIHEAIENEELELWVESLTDAELFMVINEDYAQEELINERVMTLMQRRKAGIKMRRLRFKIARMRKLKKKRMATGDMLTRRARRQARTMIRKRLGGAKGAKYSSLSPSEKIQLDKRIEGKKAIINKIAKRMLPKVKAAELVRLRSARGKKNESVNQDFESFIGDMVHEGTTENNNRWSLKAYIDSASEVRNEDASAKLDALKKKQDVADIALDKRQETNKAKLKRSIMTAKQTEIRREAATVASAVDMMIEAIEALDAKAQKANVDPDVLFIEYIDGYNNPHGEQTAQQGGFAAVNKLIAEMSQAEKDKAEDIVKGMKKKASDFTQRYGEKAKEVMYATANKLAQESVDVTGLKMEGPVAVFENEDRKRHAAAIFKMHQDKKNNTSGNKAAKKDAMKHSSSYKTSSDSHLDKKEPAEKKRGRGEKDVEHIVPQMRKAHSLGGNHVKFQNGKSHHVTSDHAKKFLTKHDSMKPAGKLDLVKHAHADHKNFKSHVNERFEQVFNEISTELVKKVAHKRNQNVSMAGSKADYDRRDPSYKKAAEKQQKNQMLRFGRGAKAAGKIAKSLQKQTNEAKDEFEPHMMYDPKTGKGYKADTEADHIKYKKMGYGHDKPSVSEGNGLWANIAAKRKRGEKMNPKGHKDAPSSKEMKMASEETLKAKQDRRTKETLAKHDKAMIDSAKASIKKYESKPRPANEAKEEDNDKQMSRTAKMNQLFRMGLAQKGELALMQRMMKKGDKALADPKLRTKMYELMKNLVDIMTSDNQVFVKVRQNVQKNKSEIEEVFKLMPNTVYVQNIDLVNSVFDDFMDSINISEDMSGMSVKSGHKRSADSGAGMTKKGVDAYKRRNPGSKLKTAVTTPPSKLKAGSKDAGRRKAFCARSSSWDGERGKAARRRWNC